MGFITWFSNAGSIGSTARWAIKGYASIKSKSKKLSDSQIFAEMINIRYTTLPDKKKQNYLLKQVKKMPGLYGLVVDILCIEAELHKNDGYYIDDMVKPIFLALEKTNFPQKTKYGKLKFIREEIAKELGVPNDMDINDKLWHPGSDFIDYVLNYYDRSRKFNFED